MVDIVEYCYFLFLVFVLLFVEVFVIDVYVCGMYVVIFVDVWFVLYLDFSYCVFW